MLVTTVKAADPRASDRATWCTSTPGYSSRSAAAASARGSTATCRPLGGEPHYVGEEEPPGGSDVDHAGRRAQRGGKHRADKRVIALAKDKPLRPLRFARSIPASQQRFEPR
jgi:hypothetical protein